MGNFNDRYNTDDVHLRAVQVGLINVLNRSVVIEQVISDTESKMVPVPFYPAQATQERFMQDFYLHYHLDCDTSFAEGNYDQIPRGVVTLESFTIDSASLVNKFVRGTYNRHVDSQVKAYSDYINVIPMNCSLEAEIKATTLVEAYKIVQEFISTFYKSVSYQVSFRGFRVPCQVGFAQDYTIVKPVEFTFGDDKAITITFPMELETYLPVVGDPYSAKGSLPPGGWGGLPQSDSERFRGNTMHRGIGNIIYEVVGEPGKFAEFTGQVKNKIDDGEDDTGSKNPYL